MALPEWGPQDVEALKGRSVIKFWAPWCGPCHALTPAVERAADRFSDVVFGQVNIDEHPALAAKFGIRALPTIVGFQDGGTAWSQTGAVPGSVLEGRVEKWA